MSSMAEDRLSNLPEEILSNILSLMLTKFAVQTSILSKRWRYKWMDVTNLDFDDHIHPTLVGLTNFVDMVLNFCKTSQIDSFRLHFSRINVEKQNLSNWIDKAVTLNTRELDIQVPVLELPLSFFTCNTLTKLRLHRGAHDEIVWEFPCSVNLPCLKSLDIVVFARPHVSAFRLIRGCPVLEILSLVITWLNDDEEEDYIFNIPTLKRLKLSWLKCRYRINKVVLRVPNLEYLFVGGILCSSFVMADVSSLVEACVSFYDIRFYHLWFELINGIKGVKSLSAQNETLVKFMFPFTSSLPIFPNMKQLELKGFWHSGQIPQFLESCPELKHLCVDSVDSSLDYIRECSGDASLIEPKLVPACMLTNLTSIQFSQWVPVLCAGFKTMELLEYMLRNAEVLKTATITWKNLSFKEEMELCTYLLKIPRASLSCEIHVIGSSLRVRYW